MCHHLLQRGEPLSAASSKLRGNRVVLVDEPAEHVAPTDRMRHRRLAGGSARGHAEVEAAVGTLLVVVKDVLAKDRFKVAPPEHEGPVEALGAYGPHKTFSVRVTASGVVPDSGHRSPNIIRAPAPARGGCLRPGIACRPGLSSTPSVPGRPRFVAAVHILAPFTSRGSNRLLGSADKPSRPSTVEDRPTDLVSQPLIL